MSLFYQLPNNVIKKVFLCNINSTVLNNGKVLLSRLTFS